MKTAVAYLRVSTDKQEYSPDSQFRLIKDYAQRNNIIIKHTYSDEGISGRKAEKRPAFMQMIEDSVSNDFECVLIYDSSRFARNLEQSLVYKSILKKNGVNLISITEPNADEDTSLITDALLGAMNEMYSRKLSKNVKRGMEQKALRGTFLSAPPYGYRRLVHNEPITINEEEAEIVKYIFKSYLDGKGTFRLARELNDKGIRTKFGNKIERRGILYILQNVTYKGYLKWSCDDNTILRQADHLPIIDEETFNAVQEKIEEHHAKLTYKKRPPESCKHWLSGMMYCSVCGNSYSFNRGTTENRNRFRCGNYARGRCKIVKCIFATTAEKIAITELKRILNNPDELYKLNIKKPLSKKRDFDTDIKKINQSLLRAKEAYLSQIDTIEEYKENKNRLSKELENLEKLKEEENKIDEIDYKAFEKRLLNTIKVLESDVETLTKQTVARELIEKIVVDGVARIMQFYFWG